MFRHCILNLVFILLPIFMHGQSRNLDYYFDKGFSQNPSLQDYRNQILSNRADSQLILARLKPDLKGVGQLLYAPTYKEYGYDPVITNGGAVQAQIQASQPIFNRKIRLGEFEKVGIQGKTIWNSLELFSLLLKHDIINSYIAASADYELLRFNQGLLQLLRQESELLRQLASKGLQSQASFLGFLMEVQGMERQAREFRIQFKKDLAALNAICGINDSTEVILEYPQISADTSFKGSSNPFLRQYYYDSLRIANSRVILNNHYLPTISWIADAGIYGTQVPAIYKNSGISFGLNFSVPIYDGHQRDIESQKISIEENTRTHYLQFFYSQRQQELGRIRKELTEVDESIKLNEAQKTSAEQMVSTAKQLLNAGTMTITDYMLMLRNYRELSSALNQVKFRRLQLINEINYFHW